MWRRGRTRHNSNDSGSYRGPSAFCCFFIVPVLASFLSSFHNFFSLIGVPFSFYLSIFHVPYFISYPLIFSHPSLIASCIHVPNIDFLLLFLLFSLILKKAFWAQIRMIGLDPHILPDPYRDRHLGHADPDRYQATQMKKVDKLNFFQEKFQYCVKNT